MATKTKKQGLCVGGCGYRGECACGTGFEKTLTKTKKKVREWNRVRPMTAWADVGSHGGIFYHEAGPVARLYPTIMNIYKDKISEGLVEVRITEVCWRRKRKL